MDNGENKKMEIEITRYHGIVKAFNSPTSLAKLIIVISLIIVVVFLGVSIIALVVKSYYPYKTVNSNEYGATIIENEDKDVIYWLFNTADLWANSGIHVQNGDVISVRASGAFHSSIHHLVHDADKNRMGRKWLNPMGGQNTDIPRDEARASYRISSAHSFNTLLMQVIPDDVELKDQDGNWKCDPALTCYLDGRPYEGSKSIKPDIYAIGAERDKVTIRSSGVLYFAVNDIALTKDIIMQMKEKVNIGEKGGKTKDIGPLEIGQFPIPNEKGTKLLLNGLNCIKLDSTAQLFSFSSDKAKNSKYNNRFGEEYKQLLDSVEQYNRLYDSNQKINQAFDYDQLHYQPYNPPRIDDDFLRSHFTELDYYLIRDFVDAWFADNVGSYLIVIERERP